MVRIYTSYQNRSTKHGVRRSRYTNNKKHDIYQDEWAPTPKEMRQAERAVYNSHARLLALQGNARSTTNYNNDNRNTKLPQHSQFNKENHSNQAAGPPPNNIRRLGNATGKIIYADPVIVARVPVDQKAVRPKKKAVLYAKPITQPVSPPPPPPPPTTTTKTKTTTASTEPHAAQPIPRKSSSPFSPHRKVTKGKKSKTKHSRSGRLWSTLDCYFYSGAQPKQDSRPNPVAEESEKTEEFKIPHTKNRGESSRRRTDPSAEDEKVDHPFDETPKVLFAPSTNGRTKAKAECRNPLGYKNKDPKGKSHKNPFVDSAEEPTEDAAPVPPKKCQVQSNSEREGAPKSASQNKVNAVPASSPSEMESKVLDAENNAEEVPGRSGVGGRLRQSLKNRIQKTRENWRHKNAMTPLPPESIPERKVKIFKEISTDSDALLQREHRVRVDNNMSDVIISMTDTKSSSFSPAPTPLRRGKSEGTEANEVVEVMDLTTISLEAFQLSFQENSNSCLIDIYETDYPVHKSLVSGTLSIALPQDVFLLVSTQLGLLDEYIARNKLQKTPQGDRLLVDSVLSILKNISARQEEYRDSFLLDGLEECIAAANSFLWMVEKVEEFMDLVSTKYPHLRWFDTDPVTWMPCQEAKGLCCQFGQDAVVAASGDAVCFIMNDVDDSGLSSLLLSPQWEEELVHNEVSVAITRIWERNISMASKWLEQEYLFHKFVGALVRATICFYMEGIVHKANKLRSASRSLGKKTARKKVAFRNPQKACGRLGDDIAVLQDYFEDIAKQNIALARVVSKEFSFLSLLVQCMLQAVKGLTMEADTAEFVIAVHKETGANFDITKFFMSDIWLLMGPKGQHQRVEQSIDRMHQDLRVFNADELQETTSENGGFKLHEVMLSLYKERIRNERSYYSLAEESIKQTQRGIRKELRDAELKVQYFIRDLQEDFAALNGTRTTQAEF